MSSNIRNFSIIAHIDHGKSTLADRLLELTHTIEEREMQEQVLDSMDLERERGITIKMQPVRMEHDGYILNLIDTPGHVDFAYEVSRSLAAVEGALLVVDATQGIQAQTLANLHFALEQDLTIIPVINKIDMPAADPDRVEAEIKSLLGNDDEVIRVSAKTGENVKDVLKAVIEKIPPPKGNSDSNTQILIFDSLYDTYQGVIGHIMLKEGTIKRGDQIYLIGSQSTTEALEVGVFRPTRQSVKSLSAGEIGYVITGLRELKSVRVGDTIISQKAKDQSEQLKLAGYKKVNPVVFAGLYPKKTEEHEELREALEKINLNDASFSYEPERSDALGPGFRAGFLGMLHLDIIKERIAREYNLDVIITTPSVEFRVELKGSKEILSVKRPQEFPDPAEIEATQEPWVKLEIVSPAEHMGSLMALLQERRGEYKSTEYLDQTRAILHYLIPLNSILTDFYDKLKSASQGYASLAWEFDSWQKNKIVRLDIIIAENVEEALAQLVYEPDAYKIGKEIVERLKEALPRQMFVIKIQAAIGGKIIAAERLSAFRKDVTAKLYGGDVTRKRKLLEKQKKGKKKMMGQGKVEIPSNVYMEILKK
jgi:GTP-binding protein LepA